MDEEKRIATAPAEPRNDRTEKTALELFLERAPDLTEAELEEINGLFRAFIFRRRSTDEYWTTCCRRHVCLEREKTVTPEMRAVMEAEHAPEPESVGVYHGGAWYGSRLKNEHCKDRYQCPHCGKEVTVKELGRTGRRKNLTQWRRGVCLKADKDGVWAVGWWAKKSYVAPEASAARQAKEAADKQCLSLQQEKEALEKQLRLSAPEMAEFKVIFGQAQEALNKAVDALWKLPADKVDGGVRAVKALLDRAGKRLEEERYEAVMPE